MARREFEIAFVGLQPGEHHFEYHITDAFFEAYQPNTLTNCNATVKLTLEKNTNFMLLTFAVGGTVVGLCDKCGNDFPLTLWDDFNMVVKQVENPAKMNEEEEDPDVYYISRTESILTVKDWIYEFIHLSIPMQVMCTEAEMGKAQCNTKVLAMLEQMNVHNAVATDERWKGLDQFKKK